MKKSLLVFTALLALTFAPVAVSGPFDDYDKAQQGVTMTCIAKRGGRLAIKHYKGQLYFGGTLLESSAEGLIPKTVVEKHSTLEVYSVITDRTNILADFTKLRVTVKNLMPAGWVTTITNCTHSR